MLYKARPFVHISDKGGEAYASGVGGRGRRGGGGGVGSGEITNYNDGFGFVL